MPLNSRAGRDRPEHSRIILLVLVDPEMVELHFQVRDTGIGISEEMQVKVSKPFKKRSFDYPGIRRTGLGLAIARSWSS
jgi:signal transduction histidine kinase